ncbi:hypothetical protein RUM43_000201 [Polyplax serrata]|uniref:Uncharacterized protein n=1 Tax=Polyplax serrata TaxID=468196 RepID=A0AAN8SFJ9_POLSC
MENTKQSNRDSVKWKVREINEELKRLGRTAEKIKRELLKKKDGAYGTEKGVSGIAHPLYHGSFINLPKNELLPRGDSLQVEPSPPPPYCQCGSQRRQQTKPTGQIGKDPGNENGRSSTR